MTSLIGVFAPASVAIAGAGMQTAGECYLNSLLAAGFKGRLYPLNPKGGEISGLRVYPHLREVPGTVDYVVSCVPALSVPQLVRECSEKGVKWMSLLTAGFSETGTESGRNLEAQIVRLARAGGVRVIGPNCMGVYCPESGMVFASDLPLERGKVAFICQSGGNAIYFVRLAAERGIKFSKVVSYGNACDVNESELIDCLADDSETEVLALYIEGPKDGQRLYGALSRAAARKPVVVLKGGTTEA
ncbi:MAG: CoA-binding protein, partial [Chloroflexi bacterium]|nr:CoA-binding protein [Chloroflexota bacterium]